MNPTVQSLHIDQYLSTLSIAYSNPSYIADQILPLVPVLKQSDIVPTFNQSPWFRDEAKPRSPGTKSERAGYTVDNTKKYFCDEYSFATEIPDPLRANADSVFNLDREASLLVADKLQMRREVAFSTNLFKTTVWGADKAGNSDFTYWSDFAAGDPVNDLITYMDTVEGSIGREPNTLAMGKQVWLKLRFHPAIVDLIKYVQKGIVTEDLVASLTGLNKILVGRAIYTTSPEGTAEASVSYSRIWGKNALLVYVPDAPSLMTPAAGYTFQWQELPNLPIYIRRLRDEERRVDIIEGSTYFDQKITVAKAGVFLSGAVA